MKSVLIVAQNTFKEIIRDRILFILVVFALMLIGVSIALGQLSFTEQVRISANFGFAGIHLSSVILSIFAGGSLVAKEIDKKTVLTLLVRPLSRFQFLAGKYLGLLMVVGVVMTGLLLVLSIVMISIGFAPNISFLIASYGVALESLLLLAVALLLSTFTRPMMVAGCAVGIFLIGHWVDTLHFFAERSSSVGFSSVGSFVAAVFPNLEKFNWRSEAIYYEVVPVSEVVNATFYSLSWVVVLMALATFIFREKDLG